MWTGVSTLTLAKAMEQAIAEELTGLYNLVNNESISKLKSLPKNIFLALLVGGVSLASQYVAAKYMGAESPAIIGSILSIIVIVIYGKLTASKEEKTRKSHP